MNNPPPASPRAYDPDLIEGEPSRPRDEQRAGDDPARRRHARPDPRGLRGAPALWRLARLASRIARRGGARPRGRAPPGDRPGLRPRQLWRRDRGAGGLRSAYPGGFRRLRSRSADRGRRADGGGAVMGRELSDAPWQRAVHAHVTAFELVSAFPDLAALRDCVFRAVEGQWSWRRLTETAAAELGIDFGDQGRAGDER